MLRTLQTGHDWAIGMAGDAGWPFGSLTGDQDDRPVPKRSCPLRGGRSLLAVLDRDAEARVVLLPAGYFVAEEAELVRVLRRARDDVEELLGAADRLLP